MLPVDRLCHTEGRRRDQRRAPPTPATRRDGRGGSRVGSRSPRRADANGPTASGVQRARRSASAVSRRCSSMHRRLVRKYVASGTRNEGDAAHPDHGVDREAEARRQHVARGRAQEHEVEGQGGHTDRGANRAVARAVEQMVLSVILVPRASRNGHAYSSLNVTPASSTAGKERVRDLVAEGADLPAGMMRSAPSSQPMYQSGWDAALTSPVRKGPKIQIGLIWATPPREHDGGGEEQQRHGLGRYVGHSRSPTTLSSRRPARELRVLVPHEDRRGARRRAPR